MEPAVEVIAPGAPVMRRNLPGNPIVLGRAPRHGIAVPTARELADEHLIISVGPNGCHLALLPGVDLQPSLHGKPFQQSDIPWGDEVVLGRTSLRFIGSARSTGPSPIVLLGGLLIAGLLAWLMLGGEEQVVNVPAAPPAPPLLTIAQTCAAPEAELLSYAAEAETNAMARAERYQFDVADAVKAAELYALATICYVRGGDSASAQRTRRAYQEWATRLETEYRARQLQLTLAVKRGDDRRAVSESLRLRALLANRRDPYVAWLSTLVTGR
jgi:hypothetical protein